MSSIKPKLGPVLRPGGTDLPPIAPQPRLADGVRLDDRVGYRFAALTQLAQIRGCDIGKSMP